MTPSSEPRFSFRNVPPAIYVALGLGVAGALTFAIAALWSTGELYERYQSLERWRMLHTGCNTAATLLMALGLLELSRRHVGSQRALTRAAAWLGLASLGWLAVPPLLAILEPGPESWSAIHAWLGRGIGVLLLAGTVMLTLAAGAWRRVPLAAVGLIALDVTSYWVPVLGKELADLLGPDLSSRHVYGLIRHAVNVSATVFVVASLAAGGREPAPDPRAAAGGLRLARGVLIFRVMAAVAIAMLVVPGRSADAAKIVAILGPAVVIITMLVLSIALQRVASARLDGMPRLLLSLGAALTLWWGTIQVEQVTAILGALGDRFGAERALGIVQRFSVAGPLVATLGLALVGSAIAMFAGHRGDVELRQAATGRTTTFVVLTLASIALPLLATTPTSAGSAVALVVFTVIPAVLGLLALMALLAQAADAIEAEPGIPPARIL
ncbi:MAG TPA: hypothetical protein VK932_10050 [Kofleriaceae bacterium]|nr:hypothetical protein [Kofleriaceae bacterium]